MWYFGATQQDLSTLGVPGLVAVVLVLAGVVVFLYRDNKALAKENRDIQAQRVTDAKETRDKITEPLNQQAALSNNIYELLLRNKQGQ